MGEAAVQTIDDQIRQARALLIDAIEGTAQCPDRQTCRACTENNNAGRSAALRHLAEAQRQLNRLSTLMELKFDYHTRFVSRGSDLK
jgi:hypothetical protein